MYNQIKNKLITRSGRGYLIKKRNSKRTSIFYKEEMKPINTVIEIKDIRYRYFIYNQKISFAKAMIFKLSKTKRKSVVPVKCSRTIIITKENNTSRKEKSAWITHLNWRGP